MKHDYTICFETENELWQRVLNIFEMNESFPKKKVKGRELHHKFPRSFSKKLGEQVDNDPDNLISLTPDDHFRVHYYYYILARKGFRQPMSLAFDMMVRPMSKQISPATMEECACDYAELRRERLTHSPLSRMTDEEIVRWKEAISRANKGRQMTDEFCQKMSEARKGNGN